jgi:predicted Zn-ribbon and HTH transcriptional regulator
MSNYAGRTVFTKEAALQRHCKHCNYNWEQRVSRNKKPRQCPYCKSPKWDMDRPEATEKTKEEITSSPSA